MTPDVLRRMELAHVTAWPALETADMQGWLWRRSGGGSQRANSASTVRFTGDDPDAAIKAVEARYNALGARAQFHTFDWTEPAGLADLLQARGYRSGETTLTMIKHPAPADRPAEVVVMQQPDDGWLQVYLGAITESRRTVNAQILRGIPEPRAFFACRRNGRTISTALSVTGHGCAVVECVATAADARRQGGADAVMAGLAAWVATQPVEWVGLQVVESNAAALPLYRRLGFAAAATNRFWVQPE